MFWLVQRIDRYVAKHAHLSNYIYLGPKLEEVAIFWQMVMEQKPAVVVMLTKVEENGKVNLTLYTTETIVRIVYAVLTEQHAICFHC